MRLPPILIACLILATILALIALKPPYSPSTSSPNLDTRLLKEAIKAIRGLNESYTMFTSSLETLSYNLTAINHTASMMTEIASWLHEYNLTIPPYYYGIWGQLKRYAINYYHVAVASKDIVSSIATTVRTVKDLSNVISGLEYCSISPPLVSLVQEEVNTTINALQKALQSLEDINATYLLSNSHRKIVVKAHNGLAKVMLGIAYTWRVVSLLSSKELLNLVCKGKATPKQAQKLLRLISSINPGKAGPLAFQIASLKSLLYYRINLLLHSKSGSTAGEGGGGAGYRAPPSSD